MDTLHQVLDTYFIVTVEILIDSLKSKYICSSLLKSQKGMPVILVWSPEISIAEWNSAEIQLELKT